MILLKKFVFILSILFMLSFVLPASTQAVSFGISESDISVNLIPENPEPYSSVSIALVSYSIDLNKAFIEWRSGDKLILSGTGRTTYNLKTGAPNTGTLLEVKITQNGDNVSVTKNIIIRPSEVDLLWEAIDTYTPPFYKGKSLPSQESTIRIVAMPNNQNVNTSKIVYFWRNNYDAVESSSGTGRNSYTFKNNVLRKTENIGLSVSSTDGSYSASGSTSIPILNPEIVFYKKSPLEGVLYGQALNQETFMEEDEMTVKAEPYFLSIINNTGDFDYNWQINNEDINTPRNRGELTIRPTSRGGYATINLAINSISRLFQTTSNNLRINL